ncbi:glycosyltransferase family 39 protein [bacterium]|nr:glycosyltransferase family 39 protein [bacterium]
MSTKKWLSGLICIELAIIVALMLLYVFRGELHVDESGYVYAARQIASGLLPYHDFLFLQTPVFPYITAIPFLFMPMTFIMVRLFIMLFGLGTIVLTMVLAHRFAGRTGAVLAGFLFIVTPFQLQFFSIVRNYPVATFWFMAGLIFLTTKPERVWQSGLAMVFFCLAMCTRLTFLPLPFLYLAYLFFEHGLFTRKLMVPLMTGIVTCAMFIYPFYMLDPVRFIYNIAGFHLDISVGGIGARMLLKVTGMIRLSSSYYGILVMTVFAGAAVLFWEEHPLRSQGRSKNIKHLLFMTCVILVIGLGHFGARFFQTSYQSILFPVLVVVVTALWTPLIELVTTMTSKRVLLLTMLGSILIVLAGYGTQGLVYDTNSRDYRQALGTARYLEHNTRLDELIFSADSAIIPFMANRTIMKHVVAPEYYPFWNDDLVDYLGIFNHRQLRKLFEQQVPDVLLLSSKSFHVIMPYRTMTPAALRDELWALIDRNYYVVQSFPNALTPGDETRIYRRRTDRIPTSLPLQEMNKP